MIDGKIVKKCEKDKIRNPETKRCVKKKVDEIKKDKTNKKVEAIKKDKTNNLSKKVEAIKKVKKALIPFINRVSVDIYHRNRYLILMRRELKGKKEGCLRVYKENPDKTFSYRIGNRIILRKRIGSNSVYGIVYLSEFREMNKKVFTFASKVYPYMYSRTIMELEILNKLTNVVRMELCPHFPIFYGYVMCKNLLNNKKFEEDSFKKSNSIDKTVSQKIRKL
jgi:formyltetrahydrofolate synthetase